MTESEKELWVSKFRSFFAVGEFEVCKEMMTGLDQNGCLSELVQVINKDRTLGMLIVKLYDDDSPWNQGK